VTLEGASPASVHVYVNDVVAPSVRGRSIEIQQRDRRFIPDVAVVQRGTAVSFPNADTVFHNVFSPFAAQPFDLGTYRAGEAARPVVLVRPGVVDVYCNIHARMHARILVVPNALHVRAAADGTFRLERVPAGTREVVAWSPSAYPVAQRVQVGPSGAELTFVLKPAPRRPHLNKHGQPYGSYAE
jgi:plastocyanin